MHTNVTIQLEGWSSKRVIALMEWIEATKDLDDEEYLESSERLSAFQRHISSQVKEDLLEAKVEIDLINGEAAPVNEAPEPTPDQTPDPSAMTEEEVFDALVAHVVDDNKDNFVKFFRRFVSKTQAQLTSQTGTHTAANALTDALKAAKGNAQLPNADTTTMSRLVRVLMKARHSAGLTVLLDEDMAALTATLGLDHLLSNCLRQAEAKLSEVA